ncbi:hypothetical protein EMIHUDRAFT_441053 [Emiliania huxleyi CCMP1516]|uniref:Major facilitator superfamily (MFS) profile domain-containing protein n=2 Tax=Emiliania huxleyi TaxID=2903 RepID=A0A0D3KH68_EMIH1|nr:hypothetical protein EMIHUDRAFT_441053 [Emiliania huxleyi CCMP1516]EOD35103.1 hypothetical protein EMIHUDRAFT_441053 [Emiliania huxleyi CCMP1516]|eukprot:XP_005787532.1 hypothetical protein EMIHUDRAFT_441053 [Emiliania huxleyi CCMP1516]
MEPRGSAALSDTPYTLFASSSDGRRAGSWPYLCTLLAVLLGTGVHASKEALVPSEKSLEALGLSPVCYSALTITPVALGIVTPLAWGRLWDTRAALVLVGAPLGELVGSGLTACGLLALGARNSPAAAAAILAGLVASSACRAGITIAEFSLVGRVCGRNAAAGFGALVVAKHGMGSLMSWAVPILLGEGALGVAPLLSLQLLLLAPHAIAVCSGAALSVLHRPAAGEGGGGDLPEVDSTPREGKVLCGAGRGHGSRDPAAGGAAGAASLLQSLQQSQRMTSQSVAVLLIGLWRALELGRFTHTTPCACSSRRAWAVSRPGARARSSLRTTSSPSRYCRCSCSPRARSTGCARCWWRRQWRARSRWPCCCSGCAATAACTPSSSRSPSSRLALPWFRSRCCRAQAVGRAAGGCQATDWARHTAQSRLSSSSCKSRSRCCSGCSAPSIRTVTASPTPRTPTESGVSSGR